MTRSTALRIALLLGVVAVGTLAACEDSNNVAGPVPTRAPTPLPLGGSWIGTFSSDHPVLCIQTDAGSASAELVESGAEVTGSMDAQGGGCGFRTTLELTRAGDDLQGVAMEGSKTGAVTGALVGSELRITVAVLSDSTGYVPGGFAVLHRR